MRYADYKLYDIANGPGVRLSLFTQGCPHHCPGCFNPETWDFNGGKEYTLETTMEIIEHCKKPQISGLSILGGEPFAQKMSTLTALLALYKDHVGKPVWVWTGYTIEELAKDPINLAVLSLIDVLVDGPFIEAKKNIRLVHRGSSNQRVIDVKKTLDNFNSKIGIEYFKGGPVSEIDQKVMTESIVLYEE